MALDSNSALIISLACIALGTMIKMWSWRPSSFSAEDGEW